MAGRQYIIALVALMGLSACSTMVTSNPSRTALEQLLISTASERAATQLALHIPDDKKVFVDNTNFEGTDSKYAIATIRTTLLLHGLALVDDKKNADIVIETRAGALSTDRNTFLIGIPQFSVPIPLASGPVTIPEIALYGTEDQTGVAKFAITAYDAKAGTLVDAQAPQYGFAHNQKTTVMIFISWSDTDALPDPDSRQDPAGHAAGSAMLVPPSPDTPASPGT